jgi:hypothetical protein
MTIRQPQHDSFPAYNQRKAAWARYKAKEVGEVLNITEQVICQSSSLQD